jgi:uncharacterized protein (UPF0333 family)
MLKKFLKEEKAQGAIEYILLAGGIIVAAVVIFYIYKNIAQSAGTRTGQTVNFTAEEVNKSISEELAKL